MKNWFKQLSRAKQIALAVFLAHACLLFFLCAEHWIRAMPPKRRKVVVNTVRIAAPVVTTAAAKKSISKPAEAKKKAPKPPSKARPKPSPASESLLKEIAASLEKVSSPTTVAPKTAILIPILADIEPGPEGSSDEIIASFLQQILTLPEFGEVKAALSIDKFGHLASIEILSTKSEKNALFLKNRLPELQFPCLNEGVSLTIVFSNAL